MPARSAAPGSTPRAPVRSPRRACAGPLSHGPPPAGADRSRAGRGDQRRHRVQRPGRTNLLSIALCPDTGAHGSLTTRLALPAITHLETAPILRTARRRSRRRRTTRRAHGVRRPATRPCRPRSAAPRRVVALRERVRGARRRGEPDDPLLPAGAGGFRPGRRARRARQPARPGGGRPVVQRRLHPAVHRAADHRWAARRPRQAPPGVPARCPGVPTHLAGVRSRRTPAR